MNAVDIGPIAPADRRQPALDLFLIFACANIVATTFQPMRAKCCAVARPMPPEAPVMKTVCLFAMVCSPV